MRIPGLLKFFLAAIAAYAFFKAPGVLLGAPVPESLFSMYMFFAIITILLVMTSTEDGAQELARPLRALVEDPSKRLLRNIVFVIAPVAAFLISYSSFKDNTEPPASLRAIHPAPPASFKAYDKTFDMSTLQNPLRGLETKDPEAFKTFVNEGGEIYFRNCVFCHGAKLDGKGHFAHAQDPVPLPFTGKDTIAQLKESYVFWRIATGGPGLPAEAHPWLSSMPAWEQSLTEDDIWKTVLFLYDFTGNRPRQ